MHGKAEGGIVLENVMHLDNAEVLVVDWDAVLRDFRWAHELAQAEERAREIAEHQEHDIVADELLLVSI